MASECAAADVSESGTGALSSEGEGVYIPYELKELAGKAVSYLCEDKRKTLAPAVAAAVESAAALPGHCMIKMRACFPAEYLRVGSFDVYPECLERPQPQMFSVPLVRQADRLLQCLERVDADRTLGYEAKLRGLMAYEYPRFLMFLAARAHELDEVVPPPEIEAIWLSHMLRSQRYRHFFLVHYPKQVLNVLELRHSSVIVDDAVRQRAAERTADLMSRFHSKPPPMREDLLPTVQEIIEDRGWIHDLKSRGADVHSDAFLQRALVGYQRFLYLCCKYPVATSKEFAPQQAIDLFWHTHMIQHGWYLRDLRRLVFNTFDHTPRAEGERYTLKTADPVWQQEFPQESMLDYAEPLAA